MVYSDAQLLQAFSEIGMIPIVDGRNPAPPGCKKPWTDLNWMPINQT